MAKRKSDLSRITEFFTTADEVNAKVALEAATSIVAARFPKDKNATARRSTGGRRRKETQPTLPTNGE